MIVDKLDNLGKYSELVKYEKEIKGFIQKNHNEKLPEGRYNLVGEDEVFALVQKYNSKSKQGAMMEAHKVYADLQYIEEGEEVIYYDVADELKIVEDRTPTSDIVFFEICSDKGGIKLVPGMFAYFAPQDAHMPCIQCEEGKAVSMIKIVFKIKLS